MVTAAYYPVNDTSRSMAEREYLQQLADNAEGQDLEQDVGPQVRNLSIVFTAAAVGVVGLRFFARHRQHAPLLIDDWLILVALALLGSNLVFNLVLVDQGMGLHSGRLTLDQLMLLNENVVGAEVLYTTAVNMYKISLLFLYFRIFPLPVIRKWGYICGGLSTAWNVACIFAASFQCAPRVKIWEPWVEGYCINMFLAQLCISIPSIMLDVAILCLPLPHILRLKTNLTQKIFLVFIFMLGSYVVFTSIYRFYVFLGYDTNDIPYTLAIPCAWNVIEISSGIISSCLPTLGPIIRPIVKSIMPSSLASRPLYGPKGRGGSSNPGLITIGGGQARQSKGWDKSGSSRAANDMYGSSSRANDLEMGPHITITSVGRQSPDSDEAGRYPQAPNNAQISSTSTSRQRASDEFPIVGGISKTVEIKWTVEDQKSRSKY